MTSLDEAQSRAPTAVIRDFLRNSISLADVAAQIWSGRLIVIAMLVLGLFYGLYQAHRAGPLYMASVEVLPADSDGGGGGSSSSGAIGLLSSLAGGGAGGGAVPKFTQFQFAIGSVGVAQMLEKKYDMVCVMYRGRCDRKTHTWRPRTGFDAAVAAFLARVAGLPDPNGPNTVVDLAHYNFSAISITKDKTSGLVTLSYYNSDPKFASDYLLKVMETTNNYVREQDRATARNMVDYVAHRVATNTNVEQRAALDSLLLQQERRLMMTEVSAPYAATILDGPTVTPMNNVLKTIAINGFMFMVLGMAIAVFRNLVPVRWRFWSRI
ncbi:MAG: hypothetical protein U1E93_08705 [Alphaproteobacteria bacterium]